MYRFPECWTDQMRISFLQRVVLINSYLYYETDKPVITDRAYDIVAKQLVQLQNKRKRKWITERTEYGYAFYDFDGTTGFDLWHRLNEGDKRKIRTIVSI